nr:hypothetical protein [Tanacetum cinerariifolium]
MVTLLGCGLEWCFFFEGLGMVPIWFRLRLTSIRKLKKRMRMTPNTVMKFEDLKEHGRESAVKVMKFEDLKEDGSESAVKVEELLKEYDYACTLRVRMPISSDLNQKQMNSRSTSENNGLKPVRVYVLIFKQVCYELNLFVSNDMLQQRQHRRLSLTVPQRSAGKPTRVQFQQHRQQQQQQPNQATASQPQSDQQSFHLVDETKDENEEELILSSTLKKMSHGQRLKSKATNNKEKETQVEVKKRTRMMWSQEEELILAERFIQISEDPKTGCDQQKDMFWYKILEVYNVEA